MVSDGVVYVGTRQGEVLALDAKELGEVKWRFSPEVKSGEGGAFGTPVVGSELVYVATKGDNDGKNGRLYALRKDRESSSNVQPTRGEWLKGLERGIVGGPALGEGLALVGSDDGILYAFDAKTGTREWTFPTGGAIWSPPTVAEGVVYFGSVDKHVYAVSLAAELGQAQRLLWKYKTGGAVVAKPLLLDGMVIVGSFDRKLYALKAKTSNPGGEPAWPKPFKGDDWFWAGAVSDGESIFASSMGGKLYALNKEGAPIWLAPFEAEAPIVSTPVVVEDKIVVATDDRKLHLVGARDGDKLQVSKLLNGRVKAALSNDGNFVSLGDDKSNVTGLNVEQWVQVWQVSTKKQKK